MQQGLVYFGLFILFDKLYNTPRYLDHWLR
jgi:hypothetical protein